MLHAPDVRQLSMTAEHDDSFVENMDSLFAKDDDNFKVRAVLCV